MRSQGQVRFIKISSRVQLTAAAVAAALLLAWLVTMAVMAATQYSATRDRLALLDREAKVASAESRVSSYRHNIDAVASDLSQRQEFIEKMVESHLGELPEDVKAGETVSNSAGETAQTVDKVSAALPEASGLARIEARQLAFVERLTRFADRRSAQAASAIRKLGLNPNAMIASYSGDRAEGGPLMRLSTSKDGSLDPRFERLGLSLARMDALERSLAGIPQVLPASLEFISSGFGYRHDPFTGAGAFHAGLDFRGPRGTPIYAAATGTVSFAGVKQGYGKCIEIDHGNGLMTRYAHMSRFAANLGEKIEAGTVIGAIGSTGRSTGPHLHFEVRINDRPVNPRPFLEAAPHVLQKDSSGA
ncbi:MAG: peptidoglycan DD-metalloendopeptidase family protein [Novosphingobium sp.]|nr:peptidoglycan DD-metalloendopeptidase family protein [Novosphingobium sp.]